MRFGMFKNEKFLWFLAGTAAATLGVKALKSRKARDLAVQVLAKGMKLQQEAKVTFQNMKEEATDICYDAKKEAGIEEADAQ